jgi:protein-disulfide isomerase
MLALMAVALFQLVAGEARSASVDEAELLKPGPLGDKIIGSPSAPITVVQYASLTCHHCMNFHVETWPAFREKYVDSGRVRFVVREFPLDPLAMAGFMLARCSGDDKWYNVLDALYRTQETWAHAPNPEIALAQTMQQTGMGKDKFEACLRDETLFSALKDVRDRASKVFKVNSTPTFFIKGKEARGALTLGQLEKLIAEVP